MQTPTTTDSTVFGNLPDVMVQALLTQSSGVSQTLIDNINKRSEQQPELRKRAEDDGVINELPEHVPAADGKTVVAVDGSATVEHMAGTDVYAAAAVRVKGYGTEVEVAPPDYQVEVHTAEGLADGRRINLALMGFLECELASKSDSDLVLFDGTVISVVLNGGLAMRGMQDRNDSLSNSFHDHWLDVRSNICELLQSDSLAAIPKRSTADNEFVRQTKIFANKESDMTGRATANLILGAGEYSKPLKLPTERLGLRSTPLDADYVDLVNMFLDEMKVVYFRPHEWSPVYRIELAPDVACNTELLERQLALIREQCVNPAMREPYPLYLADRFVRSLSKGMAAVTEAVRGKVTSKVDDIELTSRYLSYSRSEPYRELEPE